MIARLINWLFGPSRCYCGRRPTTHLYSDGVHYVTGCPGHVYGVGLTGSASEEDYESILKSRGAK